MKLSAKADYATRAILGLSRRFNEHTAIRIDDLARDQSIPAKFLLQILIELKSQQIVKSQRGKEGGYTLARSPAEITLGDVLDVSAINLEDTPAELRGAWARLQQSLEQTADGITFQSLLEAKHSEMYYI